MTADPVAAALAALEAIYDDRPRWRRALDRVTAPPRNLVRFVRYGPPPWTRMGRALDRLLASRPAPLVLAFLSGFAVIWSAGWAARSGLQGRWGWAGVHVALIALNGRNLVNLKRKEHTHGHRRTPQGDRRASASAGTGPATPGGAFGSAIVALPSPGGGAGQHLAGPVTFTIDRAQIQAAVVKLAQRRVAQALTSTVGVTHGPLLPVKVDSTIRGWKAAELVLAGGRAHIEALIADHRYRIHDDRAEHRSDARLGGWLHSHAAAALATTEPHEAPGDFCSCGFYLVDDPDDLNAHGRAVLEVEAWGKVVEHDHGWRAERQRILSVTVDPHCAAWACPRPASALVTALPRRDGSWLLQPFCAGCADDIGPWYRTLQLAELAQQFGTEVRWGQR